MDKATTVASRAGLLVAVALFAVNCTEPVSPERSRPVPSFSYSANGVTLSRSVGTMGQSGQLLIKGFNPNNPHRGDAIIATYFWVGSTSTNIIDSVVDVLTTNPYTRVGNQYRLVEFVHAGNYSMATYIATNVQNFPDPNTDSGQRDILAVAAYLSQPVTDGGVSLSAFTGVEDNFTAALGSHISSAGSGTAPMYAHTDPIAVNAGAVAYTVTMSGLWGLDIPPGYTRIGPGSDNAIKQDEAFAVQAGAGTVDPQWAWFFGSSGDTWLVTTLALNTAQSPQSPVGDLTATTSTSGANLDADGYTVTLDGATSQSIPVNGSATFAGLTAGSHSIGLSGVAANCTVSGANPQTVNVPGGGTGSAAFTVSCAATTGNLTATSSTSGSSLDPDGYTVAVDGGSGNALSINGSVTFSDLTAGSHTVALSGVAANCTVSGANPQTVNVPAGGTATATFAVSCVTPPGNLAVTTTTTGSSLDPDGYTVSVDGGAARAVATNGSVTLTNLSAGSHSVQLSGVAGNCTVSGANPRTISVPSGATTTTTFAVTCNSPPVVNAGPDETALTGLLYSLSVNFSDVDGNGPWSYTIEWGDGYKTSGTRTSQGTFTVGHTYNIILPRSFVIRVTVKDAAGAAGSDTKVVRVLLL